MSAPACVTATMEQWDQLIRLVVLFPLFLVALYAVMRDWFRYEDRIRRFLRRRRIRAIRARRVAV